MKSKDIASILLAVVFAVFIGWLITSLTLPDLDENPEIVATATKISPTIPEIEDTIFDGDVTNNPAVHTKSCTQVDKFFRLTTTVDCDDDEDPENPDNPDNPEGRDIFPEVN
ncbi:hypothetical protein FWF74_00825 [Candidatus Saccharibacteria bacterium]|nr:hypothetical protein [Candidatus Saccharibacteria bacterium]MCL1963282.1 hypothetical protein [Candidatus Saccharibacteria bacterium]